MAATTSRRMKRRIKLLLRSSKNNFVLSSLRERLLQIMLYSSLLVGTLLFGLALISNFKNRLLVTILVYGLPYVWTLVITFVHRLPYRLRAGSWLVMLFIIGSVNLINSGFNVNSSLFFITLVAMAVLLLDQPIGLIALFLSLTIISIRGYFAVGDPSGLPLGRPQSDPNVWIIGGILFVLMGILLVYSLSKMVNGLVDNLSKATRLANELAHANQSLQVSEGRYRALVEMSPDLVVLLDLNGNILMVNKVGLVLYGYEHQEDVIGRNIQDFVVPQEKARLLETFQNLLICKLPRDFECLSIKKDGQTFYTEYNSALIADEHGEPETVLCVGREITARKQATMQLQESKEALEEQVVDTLARLQIDN